jgi:hypothetical protein
MKIEIILMRSRENYEGPINIATLTIRVPPNVLVLDRKSVTRVARVWMKRRLVVKKWWEDNGKEWKDKFPNGNYVLISWSPIITTSALEFICQNF